MPQQVNLFLPILRKNKESFTAQTLAMALVIVLIGGSALSAAWVWNLKRASNSLQQTLDAQGNELASLRAALEAARASAGPEQAALTQELTQLQAELQKRQAVRDSLGQGVVQSGQGHAARLRLVAQTIPASAWIAGLKTDSDVLEVTGQTLAPEALNDWVARLAASPLLQGQTLNAVKVEQVAPGAAANTAASWSFTLVSRVAKAAPVGVKP